MGPPSAGSRDPQNSREFLGFGEALQVQRLLQFVRVSLLCPQREGVLWLAWLVARHWLSLSSF